MRDNVLLLNAVSVDEGFRQGVGDWRGVRTATHTYARSTDRSPWLLFDNTSDPWQLNNLATDAAACEPFDRVLDQMLAEAGDPADPGEDMLRSLGLIDAWNAREYELNGQQARIFASSV